MDQEHPLRRRNIVSARAVLAGLFCCLAVFIGATAKACSVSGSGVNFGELGLLNAAVDSTGEILLDCAAGTPFSVELDNGTLGSSPEARHMSSGTDTVTYGLYQDSARSAPWGMGSDAKSDTGTGEQQVLTVYGRIPRQASPTPASYTDTITVTITY